MERKLHFSNEDTLYLLLNIMAHDVIHDYGPAGGSEKRWEDNQIVVKQFTSDYYTFTNPLVGGGFKRPREDEGVIPLFKSSRLDNGPDLEIQPSYPKQIDMVVAQGVKPSTNTEENMATPEDKLLIDYENYINVLTEMKTDINNTIIFTFFTHYLFFLSRKGPAEINFALAEYFIVPLCYSSNYTDVFTDLSNKFIGYCYLNKIQSQLSYTEFLDILCNFLSSDVVLETIFENIDFTQIQSFTEEQEKTELETNSKKREYDDVVGGAAKDEDLTYEEANELVNKIKELNESSLVKNYLNKLNDIYGSYNEKKGDLSQEERKEYEETRKLLIKEYQKIFEEYKQTKKSGGLFGNTDALPLLKIKYSYRVLDLIENFYKTIENTMKGYYKIINKYQEEQLKIEKKRLEDLKASELGELTSADKKVRENFSTFVARAGLFVNNICSNMGVINSSYSSLAPESALRKEINILLYIADWVKNAGWQEVKNGGLDDELISYFVTTYPEIQGRYKCSGSTISNYVVNNAAPVDTGLKNLCFCPYTSILDGMSQCSWKSAQGNIEYGSMNFFITDDTEQIYYNGKLDIDTSTTSNGSYPKNIGLTLNLKVRPDLTLIGNKNTTMNGSDLEAHFVLKNTLVNVINYILSTDDATRTTIFAGGNIFGNLFTIFSSNNLQLFNILYSEILFKGTGDLFQEINSVSKFGGYTMNNYKINEGILSYNTSNGNQLRLFVANDRPSGTRFIYMLLKGKPEEINIKSMGGYYSKNKQFIVKRDDNLDNCKPEPVTTGGRKNKTRKMRKLRKVKKTRMINKKSKRFSRKTRMIHRKSKKNYRKTRRH